MLAGKYYFRCHHMTLKKKKYTTNTYICKECKKVFNIIPAKREPIFPPQIPKNAKPNVDDILDCPYDRIM